MTQRAPIVNEAFIQARRQERERAARPAAAPAAKVRQSDVRPAPDLPHPAPERRAEPVSFSASVSPTLTVEVERAAVAARPRGEVPTTVLSKATPKPGVAPAARKSSPAKKQKVKQLAPAPKGFLASAWRLLFGVLLGINIGISILVAGLMVYGARTGDFLQWLPIK